MVAFLEKSTGSDGFHQVIDFLTRSHICYALTKKPEVCVSFIKQFWRSAETSTDDNGEVKINATIDGHSLSITEGSLRRHLKLDDQDGVTSIPNSEIFEQLALMGYHTDSDKLTFQKGAFFTSMEVSYSQYSSLPKPKEDYLGAVHSDMPRYAETPVSTTHKNIFCTLSYHEDVTAPSTSLSKITSSPSHSPEPSTSHSPEPSTQHSPEPIPDHTTAAVTQPSPTQPSPTLSSPGAEHHFPTPHDSPLYAIHSHGSDEEVQEKPSTDTELFIQEVTPTEVIQDQEGSEKVSDEVSTAGVKKCTASEEVPIVSTAEVSLSTAGGTVTYTRRSAEKRSRQDKGKAIMIESESKKKSKKELEQERLKIARQWDEEERKIAIDEVKSTKKIDWNDPSVIRYHTLKMKPKTVAQARKNMIKYLKNQGNYKISDFKGMSYNDIRPIFEKVWDFNQNIEPMEHETEKMKPPEKSPEKMKSVEKMEEDDVATQKKMKEVVKEPGAKRKKSIPRKSTRKRQKMEEDAEKEELKGFLDNIPREEVPIEIESISKKFPIVDWKTCILTETFMYYQVFRGDGSSKNYKVLSEMLEDFDRQDVEELYRLVKEKYSASRLEGFDLMLWGDLYTLFEFDEEDEIWKSQHEYNLISWRLCDFCGIHILLMDNGLAIHMLTEKKYPLSQEMISKMLSRKLEVDHESSQAFELIRFIRSQVQK
ncbi:hypothetical protein Tco_1087064 [Tanacetum coccineum]